MMTFGSADRTAAEILRDPTSSASDREAVARYVETLERLFPKTFDHPRRRFELQASVSREEGEIIKELCREVGS